MEKEDKDTRITITVPASLRRMLRLQAAQADRSFSGQIVHCLKIGSGWLSGLEAAGGEIGVHTPAAKTDQKSGQEAV